jgi:hypothetical protein
MVAQFGDFDFETRPTRTARYLVTARDAVADELDDFAGHVLLVVERPEVEIARVSTIALSRTEFDAAAVERVLAAIDNVPDARPVHLPGGGGTQEGITAQLINADDAQLGELVGDYRFDISSITDDRPFFWHFTPYADVFLWKNARTNKYFITMVNRLNPQDPNSPAHLEIKLLYGGAVHDQRYIVSVPPGLADRQAWYTVLRYNMTGRDNRLNRERRVWHDYKFYLWWSPGLDTRYGTSDDVLTAPPERLLHLGGVGQSVIVLGIEDGEVLAARDDHRLREGRRLERLRADGAHEVPAVAPGTQVQRGRGR